MNASKIKRKVKHLLIFHWFKPTTVSSAWLTRKYQNALQPLNAVQLTIFIHSLAKRAFRKQNKIKVRNFDHYLLYSNVLITLFSKEALLSLISKNYNIFLFGKYCDK